MKVSIITMKKQPEITAQTRENLIDAFWSLYRQQKLDRITVKDITDKAGYNRSTFYEYFQDINDVLNQLEDALLEFLKAQIQNNMADALNDDILQKFGEVYESKGDYLSVLLGENGDPDFVNKIKGVVRPIFLEAFGLPETEVRISFVFEYGFSAMVSTITYWYTSGKPLSSKELALLLRSMIMGGVLPTLLEYATRNPYHGHRLSDKFHRIEG